MIEDSLLAEGSRQTKALQITASDFIKVALERAVQQREIIAKERRDTQGYAEHQQQPEEIEEWLDEQH
jgi:hypothetical protein